MLLIGDVRVAELVVFGVDIVPYIFLKWGQDTRSRRSNVWDQRGSGVDGRHLDCGKLVKHLVNIRYKRT